ncbi:hypothetical protein PVK06_007128 [Gossypium arboreum]|uniref:CCHC-type domain-containing protein n=1 Tax=Gossypium arboreum TaxID=29729 RepID=A0ABR0QH93_GOSAR|nr:hypothetical protein PVK06_007128 [Gossypium arboreum]
MPLMSQILINGRKQKVEYESLSTICFHCGQYGHVENTCNFKSTESMVEVSRGSPETESKVQKLNVERSKKKDGNYGPWMIVEKKSRENPQKLTRFHEKEKEGSRFSGLENMDLVKETQEMDMVDLRKSKGKDVLIEEQTAEIATEQASDGEALSAEEEPVVHQIASNLKENTRGVGMVDMGSLDSSKHTTVVFFEN